MADEVEQPEFEEEPRPEDHGPDGNSPALQDASAEPAAAAVIEDEADELDQESPLPYFLVGIGASAGGVEAYIELFGSLTGDTGMAFVIIPHLLSDHKSHLAEILSRHTSMPVEQIAQGSRPEPNHVYILPPNMRVCLQNGLFELEERTTDGGGAPRPIDFFFRSLAAHQKTRAIGVVLSGTDADGALGLKAIKGEGGITMVQSPESARFSEMPRSSISADHVDRILPPRQLAGELAMLGRQFREPVLRRLESGAPQLSDEQYFHRILALLRGVSGVDFRLYKPTTIRRRIARRMLLHRIQNMAEYAALLQGNSKELRELQEDALINVTRFFRDAPVFEALKQVILPSIFEGREPDLQVRVWVAGCSSGEEAYSIAICLLEFVSGRPFEPPIQIFGTDASEHNIQRARLGIFPESIAGEVSPERLRRFFVKVDKGYQVAKRVRDLCIFARQNLCHDPPFSKMDLISCRNVLIYMGAELQKQVLPTFHYALRPNGYLLLGTSETIREFTDWFQIADRKHKFFARIGNSNSRSLMTVAPRLFLQDMRVQVSAMSLAENWGNVELQRAADRIVLARYGPAGVVIDEHLEILQSRGHTAPFLEMPQGAVSLQLPRMLKDSIASQVTHAVRHAVSHDVPVRVEGLSVQQEDDGQEQITLEVLPIHTMAPRSRCFLVLFVPAPQLRGPALTEPRDNGGTILETRDQEQALTRLRQDLDSTKLYLQTLLEERDAKNQELVSANEEIQSANEELQSTNEELETTKEELQSSNEELQTVNDELQQRNSILTQATNDLSNLLNSVNLPVLMLNQELTIRHFTPPTQRLMNLRAPDVGRPISEIRLNLTIEELEPLLHGVLETLTPQEVEVRDREGRWYLLRVRPYRTTDNKIDGVVVILLDIDQLRRSELELRTARDFSRSVIESVPLPLAVVDLTLKIRAVNDAFRDLRGLNKENLEQHRLPDLAALAWGLDEPLRSSLEELRRSKDVAKHFEFEYELAGDHSRAFNIRGRVLQAASETFLMVTFEDISAHKQVERLLSLEREKLTNEVASAARELDRTQDELRSLAGGLFTTLEDERRRVARELHDDISQKLAVLEIDVQRVEERIAVEPNEVLRDLQRARTAIGALSEDVRRISHGLHPSVIDDLGVATALRALTEEFGEREDMIATFSAQDVPNDIPPEIATGLYRITQEALRNVSKHAGRTHVKVLLTGGRSIRLQITDAGRGFDARVRRAGLGVISMEERARMMEGTFAIESDPAHGTKVTVNIPWPQPSR